MIDRYCFKARIKPYESGDQTRFVQVFIAQHSTAKVKTATTFVKTVLTGAQMEIKPEVETDQNGYEWLVLIIEVFVAAALAGQNFIHADLPHLPAEIGCIAKLIRVELSRLAFKPEEIDFFLKYTVNHELEVTWHRSTSTRRAARALLQRGLAHFQALETLSSRHDSLITQVHVVTLHGYTSVLVSFKNKCQLRFYLKAEQAESRSKGNRNLSFVAKVLRSHAVALRQAIDAHVRIEPIFSANYLESKGHQHPKSLTPEAVEACIAELMAMARLDIPFATRLGDVDTTGLGIELRETVRLYFDGVDLAAAMAPHTFTRHRQALAPYGVELAIRHVKRNPPLGSTLCKQFAYANRWRPSAELLALAVTWDTAVDIQARLEAVLLAESTAEDTNSSDGHEGANSHE